MVDTAATRRARLLVVDDAPDTREVIQRNLTSRGYDVITARDVPEALGILQVERVDLVITDLKMPGASGLELVRHVREHLHDAEVITITGYPSAHGAISAVKSGAEEYLTKPFTQDELLAAVARAVGKLRGRPVGEVEPTRRSIDRLGLIATCDAMQRLMAAAGKAATTQAPVLITGERGTGKTTIARLIHQTGPRATTPFVVITGDQDDWLQSRLFSDAAASPGHGATRRTGVLDLIEDSTVFLDEVSQLPPWVQRRLADALGDQWSQPAGSPHTSVLRCRVLAASTEDLRACVARGTFREDLFLRLSGHTLVVPPLRERGGDVELLALRFLARHAATSHRPVPTITDSAREVIRRYPWLGNIPELENTMRQLAASAHTGMIEVSDLPDTLRHWSGAAGGVNRTLAEVESHHIRSVLASVGGNKTKAADILGINRKTLREKLRDGRPEASTA